MTKSTSRLFHFVYVTIVILLRMTDARDCNKACRDFSSILCTIRDVDCSNIKEALWCPATCDLCIPCVRRPAVCEKDTCYDRSPLLCTFYDRKGWCPLVHRMCRETCGHCVPCEVPHYGPTPCADDCYDKDPQCPRWASEGHCSASSVYATDISHLCKKTCRLCLPCSY